MRNLALISSWDSFLPSSSSITTTTIDLDENVIYVASEHNTSDGKVEVGVWRMKRLAEGSKTSWVKFFTEMSLIFHISNYSQVFSGTDFHFSNGSFFE